MMVRTAFVAACLVLGGTPHSLAQQLAHSSAAASAPQPAESAPAQEAAAPDRIPVVVPAKIPPVEKYDPGVPGIDPQVLKSQRNMWTQEKTAAIIAIHDRTSCKAFQDFDLPDILYSYPNGALLCPGDPTFDLLVKYDVGCDFAVQKAMLPAGVIKPKEAKHIELVFIDKKRKCMQDLIDLGQEPRFKGIKAWYLSDLFR